MADADRLIPLLADLFRSAETQKPAATWSEAAAGSVIAAALAAALDKPADRPTAQPLGAPASQSCGA